MRFRSKFRLENLIKNCQHEKMGTEMITPYSTLTTKYCLKYERFNITTHTLMSENLSFTD